MSFTFLEAKSGDMLEKVYAFRYKVMSEIEEFREYFLATDFPDNKESDMFDRYSVHFVGLDENSEVCAHVRLIYNCPHGYPTENQMIFNKDMFERDKLGELSRIFIDSKYRNIQTTKIIIQQLNELLYVKMMESGIEYTYGALEARFMRLLRMFKMSYEAVGKEQLQGKMGMRIPCILYTQRLGEDNPEIVKAWREKNDK